MKAWITKYALTKGVFAIDAEGEPTGLTQMITRRKGGYMEAYHFEGRDWCRTHEDALMRADVMRLKKIESLNKQIDKLQKMTFE